MSFLFHTKFVVHSFFFGFHVAWVLYQCLCLPMTVNGGSHGSFDITSSDAALPVHSSQNLDTTELLGRQDVLSDAELHEDLERFGQEPFSTAGEMASSAGVSSQDTGSDTSLQFAI